MFVGGIGRVESELEWDDPHSLFGTGESWVRCVGQVCFFWIFNVGPSSMATELISAVNADNLSGIP